MEPELPLYDFRSAMNPHAPVCPPSPRFHHRRFDLRRSTAFLLASVSLIVLAACSDDGPTAAPGPDPDPEPTLISAEELQRIVVTDANEPMGRVVSLAEGAALHEFDLVGPASYVAVSHSGRYAVLQQRASDRVHFLDGGSWTEGDKAHLHDAKLLDFVVDAPLPTHFSGNEGWMSTFFDGNGLAAWFHEEDFFAGSPRIAFEIETGGPHHSGSSAVISGDRSFFVVAPRNPEGGLPHAVHVYDESGQRVAEVDNCPGMHGNAASGTTTVFGCRDGMVLIQAQGSSVTAEKHEWDGELAELGLRNAWAASGASVILGMFLTPPGHDAPQRRLGTVDVRTGAVHLLPSLPQGVLDHSWAVEPRRDRILVMTTQGALYVYSAATRELVHTIEVTPALSGDSPRAHQVSGVEGIAAVASPTTGEVVIVDTDAGEVLRRIEVGGAPSRLGILGPRSQGMYEVWD